MHVSLPITNCLRGIIKKKAVYLVGLLLFSLISFKANAHSVQVGYVVLPNGFIRVYIEHWHGPQTTASLVNNGMSITTTYGTTTVTQNVNPTGAFNGYAWNNLPGAGANIIILATSAGSNQYNNWAYYDFAPAACGVPVNIVLNGGLTVVLQESESHIWPKTISATFNDNAPPTITPSNTNATVACGATGANVNFSATALDNCTPNPAVTFSVAPGSFFPVGTTPVTAYSSDANGNSGQLTFNVTVSVVDNTLPVISCPAPISVGTDPGTCSASVQYALPSFSDNCGVASIQQIAGLPSGALFPKGNTTNTFRVTDGSGNTATCSFVVTVTDQEPPVAKCKNVVVSLNAGLTGSITVADINNGSYDNCGPVTVSISSGKTQFDCNDIGQSIPVVLLVRDQQGLTSSCTAQVTVTDPNSYCNQPPVAICKPLTVSANGNCQGVALAADFNNGSTDPNGDAISFSVSPAGPYSIGTTSVTLTVTDSKGASSTCVTTVTVVDDTKPSFTQTPASISVVNDPGKCGALVALTTPQTADNCGVQSVTNDAPALSFFPVGTTSVNWTVKDIHGNESTIAQSVTVTDNEMPVISGTPANISQTNDAGVCGAKVSWTAATASDNCPGVTIVSNHQSGDLFPVGNTTVTYTATDAYGHVVTTSFIVTVTDDENPVISGTPANISQTNDAGVCGAKVSWTAATASDNCPGVTIVSNHQSGDLFPVGNTTVTYTATDAYGHVVTTSFVVTVNDNEAPKAKCKAVTVTLVNGAASISVADINNGSTDNCGIASVTVAPFAFSCSNIGANTVTLTVTDIHGNVSTCDATVTVVGEIPTCTIASIPTSNTYTGGVSTNLYLGYGAQSTTLAVTPAANGAPYTYSWSGATGLLSSTTSGAPVFTPIVAGSYTFTVVTTNKYGCTTSCSITICVTDIRVPGTGGKKVFVCHVPPGNPGNANTLSISVNAVPSHLGNHAGDRLGSCDQVPCSSPAVATNATQSSAQAVAKEAQVVDSEEAFTVKVAPNPSTSYFTLKLESRNAAPVSLKVMDASGRVLDARSKLASNSTIQIGHNYNSGTYYAEMIQGTKRKLVQLIKVK